MNFNSEIFVLLDDAEVALKEFCKLPPESVLTSKYEYKKNGTQEFHITFYEDMFHMLDNVLATERIQIAGSQKSSHNRKDRVYVMYSVTSQIKKFIRGTTSMTNLPPQTRQRDADKILEDFFIDNKRFHNFVIT
jgi:hypothetical protein